MQDNFVSRIVSGDYKSIARAISIIENEVPGYEDLLTSLHPTHKNNIIGITGPPGAGKSTIVDQLIAGFIEKNQTVAVLCVDPSSPFNLGALLGDRIRMNQWYNEPRVYIRSLASRASLGGLHPHIMEIAMLLQSAPFDWIIIETVGVGQSEIDIAALADITAVVLVPESGDEIQAMKSGLMEIADLFVINKSDRPGADAFAKNLERMIMSASSLKGLPIQVVKTIATDKKGIDDLFIELMILKNHPSINERKYHLLAERAYQYIAKKRMKDIDKAELVKAIAAGYSEGFNLYRFARGYTGH